MLEENRVFRELQGKKRPRLNDDQRRRLAAKGKPLGRRLLDRVAAIVTPDTIMRWHRRQIAEHHTYPHKNRVGRPGIMKAIRELIVRMATDNSGWGYLRIRGELKKIGHRVAKTTIATTLKNNGIAPSPDRRAENIASKQEMGTRIEELEQDLGEATLLLRTLADLCVHKGVVTEEEMMQKAQQLDALDGVVDGRLGKPVDPDDRSN
ncbi:MAG: hypothetical protein ACI8UD_001655 [Planctomycetota bacterium]